MVAFLPSEYFAVRFFSNKRADSLTSHSPTLFYHSRPMIYNEAIETMPRPRLRELQNRRLHEQVAYVYDRVPFYREQLDEKGIKPTDIRSIEDLPRLPFTYKTDLRDQYPFGLFAMPRNAINRIHASSGTTGKPTVIGYSPGDLKIFTEVVARSLVAAGARPGMMLHNAYGYGLFTGGLGLHDGAEKLGMNVVPVSGGMTERQLMILQDFRPEVICCTPSYAQTLAEELAKRDIAPASLNLKFALLGAEPWTETIREQVDQGLHVQSTNIYGLSEIIGPGVSNEDVAERGTGSYVWEDHFFPEIVDPETGHPLPEGETGVLVFTTLTKKGMPLLRYWTNDICTLHYDPHGRRTHVKMGPIQGRADDMLIIRGVNFFHTQVEDLLHDIHHLKPYYQVRVTRKGNLDAVEVRVEIDEQWQRSLGLEAVGPEQVTQHEELRTLQGELSTKIKQVIGLSMAVSLVGAGEIPRSQGGKLSRVVDLRK